MKRKIFIVLFVVVAAICCALGFAACDSAKEQNTPEHSHTYARSWSYNDNYHWKEPTCTDTTELKDYDQHTFNSEGKCLICNYIKHVSETHKHALIHHVASEADCITAGNIEYWTCSSCNKFFSDDDANAQINENDIIVQPKGHEWGLWDSNDIGHTRECVRCKLIENNMHTWHNNQCDDCNYVVDYSAGMIYNEIIENNEHVGYALTGIGQATDNTIIIPKVYNGKPVKEIGYKAFYNCTSVRGVELPDTLLKIGQEAFEGCSLLKEIIVPDSVESIGISAFNACSSLESMTLPFIGGQMNIDSEAGTLAYYFSDIEFENSVKIRQYYSSAWWYVPASLTKLTVTKGNLADGAFYGFKNITDITLMEGITRISPHAFSGCDALEHLSLPDSLHYVGATGIGGKLKFTQYSNGYYLGSASNPYLINTGVVSTNVTSYSVHPRTKCIIFDLGILTTATNISIPDGIVSVISGNRDRVLALAERGAATLKNGEIYVGNSNNPYLVLLTNRWWASDDDIFIQSTTKVIAENAFYNVSTRTFNIPDSVKYIGECIFTGSSGYRPTVHIGSGVIDMEDAFIPSGNNYMDYTEFTVSPNNKYYKSVNGVLYSKNMDRLIAYPAMSVETKYVIPDECESISQCAFYNAKNLEEIVLPNRIKYIPVKAFYVCSALKKINVPDSVFFVDKYAFSNCRALKSISLPDSVKEIGYGIFSYCESLENLTISGATYFGNYWIGDCKKLTNLTLGNSVINIPSETFNKSTVENVKIGKNLTTIGENAFRQCENLKSVSMEGNNVTAIGNYAFSGCANLSVINIPDGVISIGKGAFSNCKSLASIVIPNSVISIDNSAFSGCKGLTTINIPDSVKFIGKSVFSYCSNLTRITVDENNTEYSSQDGILYDKNKTTIIQVPSTKVSITIPDSVTTIAECAFEGCENLTNIMIPSSITAIEQNAFENCTNLESITVDINNKNYSSQDGILYDKNKTTILQIPQTKKIINIPASVVSIGTNAFTACIRLESITVDTDNTEYSSQGGILYNKTKTKFIHIPKALKGAVIIPNTIIAIDSYAFSQRTNITNVTLSDNVISIGYHAFWNCTSLTSVIIGESVNAIDEEVFDGCENLQSVTFKNSKGWKIKGVGSNWEEQSITLGTPADNARLLTDTYLYYYWNRY